MAEPSAVPRTISAFKPPDYIGLWLDAEIARLELKLELEALRAAAPEPAAEVAP